MVSFSVEGIDELVIKVQELIDGIERLNILIAESIEVQQAVLELR